MFDFNQPLLIAGLLLGVASSLHCLGMCSGIAASLCMAAPKTGRPGWNLHRTNLLINAGRITSYVLAGAAVGGLGTGIFGVLDRSVAHVVLRWAAAVSLGWIGLSMIGLVPLPTPLLRVATAVNRRLGSVSAGLRSHSSAGFFLAGGIWGCFPCAMVYGALFYAMLSGSWLNGALVMLGFGLGTLPPVLAAGLGLPWLRVHWQAPWLQKAVGVAIIVLGIVSTLPPEVMPEWCRIG